jgi:TRAP-type transport system periplasmic protein
MSEKYKIKWLLYHEPIDLFLRTAEAFRDEIKQLTDGRIEIEIYSTEQYRDQFANGVTHDPMALINQGDVQMSQVEVSKMGENNATDFFALELPFLFRSHEHATAVLDGPIGKSMLKSLPEKTAVTGLAFTYSGGYRVMASNKDITKAEDLKGLTMSTGINPIFLDLAEAFGCEGHKTDSENLEERRAIHSGMEVVQTTLPRYQIETDSSIHSNVVSTNHSMYLTTIIINNDFWLTLSIADQEAMRLAALNSARLERQWSVQDAENITTNSAEQARLGIKKLGSLSAEEQDKLVSAVTPIYEKYKDVFSTDLIKSIRNS